MISYEIDPSLHAAQPQEASLDDGFSRPQHGESHPQPEPLPAEPPVELLSEKSDF